MQKIDLTGQRFGRLIVLREIENYISASVEKYRQWECVCDCGNIKEYTTKILLNGNISSCGCDRQASGRKRMEENAFGIYKGTCNTRIKGNKLSKNNKSGVTGVRKASDSNSWIAEITVQKRHIYLGSFANLEDAIKARKEAEKRYFKPLIEEYERER